MKVLVVGSGGREHTIAWKLSHSDMAKEIYAAPGNAGIANVARCLDLKADDITGIAKFAVNEKIDLVVVGPEVPLCMGIVDLLDEAGVPVFGPTSRAAMIEGSKAFSKKLMRKYDIPTASFGDFTSYDDAVAYARSLGGDMWVKASGLAAGKGAVYAVDPDAAEAILSEMMLDGIFGDSGHHVVIEENMKGEEASIFALCDGRTYKLLVSSQDHKRVGEGDTGPNTGGMGAYAPAPVVTHAILEKIERDIIQRTLDGMAEEGVPYKGCLYAGIMIENGDPRVVEFNCRFGDPETQAVLPLFNGDLAEVMLACAEGHVDSVDFSTTEGFALCVVIASGGYPGSYTKGHVISGLDNASMIENSMVFHAGTKRDGDTVITSGGRVLGVTGWGSGFAEARKRAYSAIDCIHFEGSFSRRDIGHRAESHLK